MCREAERRSVVRGHTEYCCSVPEASCGAGCPAAFTTRAFGCYHTSDNDGLGPRRQAFLARQNQGCNPWSRSTWQSLACTEDEAETAAEQTVRGNGPLTLRALGGARVVWRDAMILNNARPSIVRLLVTRR